MINRKNMALENLMLFTDFTAASNVAAGHCYQIASLNKSNVISLHVISNNEDLEWAEKKSIEQIQKIDNYDSTISFKPIASSQSLFQGMNKWLEQQGVSLAFMATHGKKDLQFVTGSNALKLIFNAEVPILVVQQKTPVRPYKHILLPLFSHQAGMQFPIDVLKTIVKTFNAKITLLKPAAGNSQENENLMKSIEHISSSLQNEAQSIEIKSSEQPEKKFSQAAISASKDLGADLIVVLIGAKHHREEAEKTKKFYQSVITNEHAIPVLCL
jgi:hypothetical protein